MVDNQHLSLPEQVLQVELAYYRQLDDAPASSEDVSAWEVILERYRLIGFLQPYQVTVDFNRFVLERHGYSLHHYMASHLSLEQWQYWFEHKGLLTQAY